MKLIFGQKDYAEQILCYLPTNIKTDVKALMFPLQNGNPAKLTFDFSVYDDVLYHVPKETEILVAFSAHKKADACSHLQKAGFSNLRIFNAAMDNSLKRKYFKQCFAAKQNPFVLIDELPSVKSIIVYMAKSIFDKQILNYPQTPSSCVVPIQVGAALIGERIADVTDATGDNISKRNRHYSEMTAFYWMWKNAAADFVGICHYRRVWKDLDYIAAKLQTNDIDAVLPVPTLSLPSVRENYFPRFIPQIGNVFLQVLADMTPEYIEQADRLFADNMYYACNMCILKRKVLDDLCAWMFPIVFEVERRVGELPDQYYNRYCGFCTELLITLYFRVNKQNWRIVHADKIFIG